MGIVKRDRSEIFTVTGTIYQCDGPKCSKEAVKDETILTGYPYTHKAVKGVRGQNWIIRRVVTDIESEIAYWTLCFCSETCEVAWFLQELERRGLPPGTDLDHIRSGPIQKDARPMLRDPRGWLPHNSGGQCCYTCILCGSIMWDAFHYVRLSNVAPWHDAICKACSEALGWKND